MATTDKNPNPIDIHVGARVRMKRKLMSMSQETLANKIGLTFQQIQKYERGTNRISASKLYEISKVLKVSIAYFYEEYIEGVSPDGFEESEAEAGINYFLRTTEGVELAEAFPRIESSKLRRRILELVRTLAEDE